MFTGIIEELGRVSAIEKQPDALRLTIDCHEVLSDLKRGDSISCSGTCLTAIEIDDKSFTADVMLETIRRSSLDGVKIGDPINLDIGSNPTTQQINDATEMVMKKIASLVGDLRGETPPAKLWDPVENEQDERGIRQQ